MTDDFVKLDEWTDEDRDKYRLIQVHSGLYYLEIEYVDSSGQRYWHDAEEFSGSNHASVADPLCRRLKERGLLGIEGRIKAILDEEFACDTHAETGRYGFPSLLKAVRGLLPGEGE